MQKVLTFIRETRDARFRDISAHMNWNAPSTAFAVVRSLKERKLVKRDRKTGNLIAIEKLPAP